MIIFIYLFLFVSGKDTDSSALEEDGDDLKALEARIRCMTLRKKPSQGKLLLLFFFFSNCLSFKRIKK